jgi:small GTP-binding protein
LLRNIASYKPSFNVPVPGKRRQGIITIMQRIENTEDKTKTLLDLTERQITYDRDELREEFLAHIDMLFSKLEAGEVIDLLGEEFRLKLRTAKKELENRLRGDFRVVVMGDFKRGKSTLVNALLETPIAPTNITPETVTINEITFGDKAEAQICLTDQGRVALTPEEIASETLIPIIENLAGQKKTVSHLEIKAPVEWLKNVNLVDTPGLGDVLAQFDSRVQNYLNQADTIVYLISAVSPLSETETNFLQLSVAPQDFPKIIFVINMLDLAQSGENAEKVLSHITQKLTKLFPNAQIYGLSAFDEVCRLNNERRPNSQLAPLLENNFRQFRSTLENSILLDRNLIQLDRACDLLRLTLSDFEHSVLLLAAAFNKEQTDLAGSVANLADSNSELLDRVAASKQNFRSDVILMGEEAVKWLSDFLDRIESEAMADLADFEYDEIRRHFHFFLSDSLRAAVTECFNAHRRSILKAAETAGQEINKEIRLIDTLSVGDEGFTSIASKPEWTNIDSIGTIASFLIPAGLFVELGSKALFKKSEESEKFQNYRRQLETMLPDWRAKITTKVRESYLEIVTKFERQVDNAFEYQKKSALAALEQARLLQESEQREIGQTTKQLTQLQQVFSHSRDFVRSLTEKLWNQTSVLQAEVSYLKNPDLRETEDDVLDNSASQPILV